MCGDTQSPSTSRMISGLPSALTQQAAFGETLHRFVMPLHHAAVAVIAQQIPRHEHDGGRPHGRNALVVPGRRRHGAQSARSGPAVPARSVDPFRHRRPPYRNCRSPSGRSYRYRPSSPASRGADSRSGCCGCCSAASRATSAASGSRSRSNKRTIRRRPRRYAPERLRPARR